MTPAANARKVGADQPWDELSVKAHVGRARPIVARRAPAPSSEALFPTSSSGPDSKASQIATIAIGTLIRKISRHDPKSISHPPSTAPIAPAPAAAAAQTPITRPFASPDKAIPKIARLFGINKAALAPCTRRAGNMNAMLGPVAHASDARASRVLPVINLLRRLK